MRRLLIACLILLMAAPVSAATVIGKVTRIAGEATGTSEGAERRLASGSDVHLDEVIATGEGARLELIFDDGTVLTVGAMSKVTLDAFLYEPAGSGNRLDFAIDGPFRFVSGKIGKVSASTVGVRAPFATIGIRGTEFWGGPIDGRYGVFLIEGAVSVTNEGGSAVLDRPGEGVNIDGPGAQPGAVTLWPDEKVERAIATVTFR